MAEQSGEKTEEPTEKRLRDARNKGQVAMSRDLTGGTVFIILFAVLYLTADAWLAALIAHMKAALQVATTERSAIPQLTRGLHTLGQVLLPPLLAAMVGAIAIGFFQTGGVFALEALKFDPQKVMPDFKRVVSLKALVELAKGFAKVALAAAVAYAAIKPILGSLIELSGASPLHLLLVLGNASGRLGKWMIIVVAAIGAGDFFWQRHQHLKQMRMTREEVKREHKEQEGDPHHKQERMRLHKELLQQRMLNAVRKADFVVVNPDHIAVAIRYEKDSDQAPQVVAKGERILAEKIKEVAREAGVPIFRDVSLARALRDVEEGDEIPEALYEAVAEILRVVYQQPASSPTRPPPPNEPPPGSPATPGWRRA